MLSVRRAHHVAHFLIGRHGSAYVLTAQQLLCPPRRTVPALVSYYHLNRRAGIFLRNPVLCSLQVSDTARFFPCANIHEYVCQ